MEVVLCVRVGVLISCNDEYQESLKPGMHFLLITFLSSSTQHDIRVSYLFVDSM